MHDNTDRKRKRGALEDISNTHKSSNVVPSTRMTTRLNLKAAAAQQLTQSQTSVSETQSTSPSQEDVDAPVVISAKKRKASQEVVLTTATSGTGLVHRRSSLSARRVSLESQTQEQRERQRMFDVRMSSLSSEFDLDVYVDQVRMIDSKENDAIAREVDMFHRSHEHKYRVQSDYLTEVKDGVKSDINCRMRGILVDWLGGVGEEYKLVPHTLHLAIHLVDRCLSTMRLARGKLQLLGCACMILACKYEEVVAPSIEDFVYISDHTYTNDEMLAMETTVLEALEYKLSGTNVYHFLERFILAGCTTEVQQHFAHTPTLHYYTKYNAVQVVDCVAHLYKIHDAEYQVSLTDPEKTRAVTDKYSTRSHVRVGKLAPVAPPSSMSS
ncbi:hypothetical protein DYB36_006681 [Aphanomyces astaci]|uniref:Cyclin-like domain-containing protein n=1 Tax=Aphanomyces astaci TaxID=112090 RepID=A0A397AC70_APHAT|nr:hypothetical protein DYB36_006681 [Aphanomyces astaci]